MPYAVTSFVHLDLDVVKGDELPADHPMVAARPDLFTDTPPSPAKRAKPKPKE